MVIGPVVRAHLRPSYFFSVFVLKRHAYSKLRFDATVINVTVRCSSSLVLSLARCFFFLVRVCVPKKTPPTFKLREVKKLDSDMQMLVYENYNKFISATDTIRKMAQNVEGMETEMTDLKSSMDSISNSSAKVNDFLESE